MGIDWDDAYANGAYIDNAQDYIAQWRQKSLSFREKNRSHQRLDVAYGQQHRQKMDVFFPGHHQPVGLFVFVHGGYWLDFDKSSWSHLAEIPLSLGWAVVIPSYSLCPHAHLGDIYQEISMAVGQAAQLFSGPICLSGHSAGGQLVTRLVCENSLLPCDVSSRIHRVYSLSGLHDLRPLQKTKMQKSLHLDDETVLSESPALQQPLDMDQLQISCWVGSDERPEFIRQSTLLPTIWSGFDCQIRTEIVSDLHHFNILSILEDSQSALIADLRYLEASTPQCTVFPCQTGP